MQITGKYAGYKKGAIVGGIGTWFSILISQFIGIRIIFGSNYNVSLGEALGFNNTLLLVVIGAAIGAILNKHLLNS